MNKNKFSQDLAAHEENAKVDTVTKGLFYFFIGSMGVGIVALLFVFLFM